MKNPEMKMRNGSDSSPILNTIWFLATVKHT